MCPQQDGTAACQLNQRKLLGAKVKKVNGSGIHSNPQKKGGYGDGGWVGGDSTRS